VLTIPILLIIAEVPDNVFTAAISLTVNAAGAATCKITVLLTPEDIDAAACLNQPWLLGKTSRGDPVNGIAAFFSPC